MVRPKPTATAPILPGLAAPAVPRGRIAVVRTGALLRSADASTGCGNAAVARQTQTSRRNWLKLPLPGQALPSGLSPEGAPRTTHTRDLEVELQESWVSPTPRSRSSPGSGFPSAGGRHPSARDVSRLQQPYAAGLTVRRWVQRHCPRRSRRSPQLNGTALRTAARRCHHNGHDRQNEHDRDTDGLPVGP